MSRHVPTKEFDALTKRALAVEEKLQDAVRRVAFLEVQWRRAMTHNAILVNMVEAATAEPEV